jgi:hypothetical protein
MLCILVSGVFELEINKEPFLKAYYSVLVEVLKLKGNV